MEWLQSLSDELTRGIAAKETCPDTGREHLQGRMTFRAAHRLSYMKKLHPTAHWEITRASSDWTYFHKRGEPPVWETDTRAPGARTDLTELKALVDEGKSEMECYEAHFGSMVRYGRGIERYRALVEARKRRPRCEVHVLIGAAGAGKSTQVEERWPEAYWLTPCEDGKIWWDGYDGQDTVVLDDFDSRWFPYKYLLKLLNWTGKFRVNTKGGSKWLCAKTFVFTSTIHPHRWYIEGDEQLYRRLHNIEIIT